jgi:hypothetical protein
MTERLFYGASLLFCLPTGMSEADSAGTGAVFRARALHALATDAGFSAIDTVPIESPLWRFYLLRTAAEDLQKRPQHHA